MRADHARQIARLEEHRAKDQPNGQRIPKLHDEVAHGEAQRVGEVGEAKEQRGGPQAPACRLAVGAQAPYEDPAEDQLLEDGRRQGRDEHARHRAHQHHLGPASEVVGQVPRHEAQGGQRPGHAAQRAAPVQVGAEDDQQNACHQQACEGACQLGRQADGREQRRGWHGCGHGDEEERGPKEDGVLGDEFLHRIVVPCLAFG